MYWLGLAGMVDENRSIKTAGKGEEKQNKDWMDDDKM